jgi:hypothetical protein
MLGGWNLYALWGIVVHVGYNYTRHNDMLGTGDSISIHTNKASRIFGRFEQNRNK